MLEQDKAADAAVNAAGLAAQDQSPAWLEQQAERFLGAVDLLWDSDFNAQSALAGVTTGYIVTHVARCADDCADRLHQLRTGVFCRFDSDRRFPEDPGSLRPGAVLIEDVGVAIERLLAELQAFASDADRLSSTLDEIRSEFLVEVILHHADLGSAPLGGLEEDLAHCVLTAMIESVISEPSWPVMRVHALPSYSLSVEGADGQTSVYGAPGDLLAWVTGRPVPGDRVSAGEASLPQLPARTCSRLNPRPADGAAAT